MKKRENKRNDEKNLAHNSAATPDFVEVPDDVLTTACGGVTVVPSVIADVPDWFSCQYFRKGLCAGSFCMLGAPCPLPTLPTIGGR